MNTGPFPVVEGNTLSVSTVMYKMFSNFFERFFTPYYKYYLLYEASKTFKNTARRAESVDL